MNHRRKGPAVQMSIEELKQYTPEYQTPDEKIRLARHRAAQSPIDTRCVLDLLRALLRYDRRPSQITSPGRRRIAESLTGRIVHYGVGQAKRGEYGTPKPERPREIRRREQAP